MPQIISIRSCLNNNYSLRGFISFLSIFCSLPKKLNSVLRKVQITRSILHSNCF